ncbi:DOCK family protein [Abortiporus biennis]
MVSSPGNPLIHRRGVWEPLPLIVYGYAVHPLSPSRRDTRLSNRTRISTFTDASGDEHLVHRDVVSLEVGDEVYAFEKYTPRDKEVEGEWYRGYVVTTRRQPVQWPTSSDPSSSAVKSTAQADEAQQVFIGIFPASHIFVRDESADAEGRLQEVANALHNTPEAFAQWTKEIAALDSQREKEEEEADTISIVPRKSFKLRPPPDQANSARAHLPVYPASIRSTSPTPTEAPQQLQKPIPPRPSLRSGDDTVSGAEQPIVDEIASALREWYTLMFHYLARRDYRLFQIVREHIEALHFGRRQLLAQTLSLEETVNLRRQCVARLVSGNIVQGLDIIVRHPTWGGLVNVDVEGEVDSRNWVSAVRMYAMQSALAYTEPTTPNTTQVLNLGAFLETGPQSPFSRSHSNLQHEPSRRNNSKTLGSFGSSYVHQPGRAKFYHLFLDLRAVVATLCAPGETTELFFSLYNHNGSRFVSEDFCAVLNHNGVLARDPTARIRTFFTDIVQSDAQDPIYLVCRIVRNGSMKGNTMGSIPESGKRNSEASFNGQWQQDANASSTDLARGELPAHFRRPFGCAVLELTQLKQMVAEQLEVSATTEHKMPIFVASHEATFSMLHQDIIQNNTKDFEKPKGDYHLTVSLKIFYGDADTIIRENTSLLLDTPLSLRLGFPDVVFPGDVRNELYIKLWSGDFSNSQPSSSRRSVANFSFGPASNTSSNVQVTMEVRDQQGNTIDRIISQCSGEPVMTYFHSMVFQRMNQPTFGELVKVKLPFVGAQQLHLFFTFRHRNTRDRTVGRGSDTTERPFAFAFLPLFPDGRAFLEDGSHTLALYKADRMSLITAEQYLAASAWIPQNSRTEQINVPVEMQRVAPLLRDSLTIRSSLLSTKFTQNPVLLSLLNWQQLADTEVLSRILTMFTFVGKVETVRFLQDVFNALFDILTSAHNRTGDLDLLVFNALVNVLAIVQDHRFSNFQPVLDVYIEQHFSCDTAHAHMIKSMNTLLQDPTDNALRSALKVWHYIFKFITRSRELQREQEGGAGSSLSELTEQTFKRDLRSHLSEINRMMSASSPPAIIGTQTIALQHFTSILPELKKVFPVVELVTIATTFANSIVAQKGKLIMWKLIMYLQICKGFLFDNPQSRSLLVESVVMWIKPFFGRFDEYTHVQPGDSETAKDAARISWLESVRLSISTIAVMLDKLQQNLVNPAILADRNQLRQEQFNIEYLLSLLPRVLESYKEFQNPASIKAIERTKSSTSSLNNVPVSFPESYPFSLLSHLPKNTLTSTGPSENKTIYNPGMGESAVVFLVLALSAPRKVFLSFLESSLEIEGREHCSALLMQIFRVGTSILNNEAFPSNWLNINILAYKVVVKIMDPIASLLEREFIPTDPTQSFDVNIWRGAFQLLLKLLSSEHLVIEEFNAQKRRAVWRLAGDIRGEGAIILWRLWLALGPSEESVGPNGMARYTNYQVALNSLVGQVVDLCVSHHDQLRYHAVQILYCMIVSEYHEAGHFDDIEHELISKLDALYMSDNKGDDISRTIFINQLSQLFDAAEIHADLRARVTTFLDSINLFIELLINVSDLPEGEEYFDDRVMATLRLMNFIRRIGRDEIYIKYVHQLVNMHLQSQNYVEAALTLKLHADLHDWDLNTFAPPMEDLGLPQQSQFHRKETLYLLILDYLGKGKAWETAIEICKELAYQHMEVTFNYARLAEILRHEAALLEHIITDQRYYSDYFRVSFYGNFPVGIRNKQFIYRGYEWEKFGAFCERMLNKHPGAQLLKIPGDPPVDIRFGTDQYIQCTTVNPEPNRDQPIFTNPDVPPQIRAYHEHSGINLFSYSREIRKLAPDNSEEIWIEKTYLTTEEAFPTILRRSEVLEISIIEISPIESALQDVQQKTRELAGLNLKYSALSKTAQMVSTTPLSMSLNTAVDAPNNTGVPYYRQVFLSGDYVRRYPERAELVEKLRTAIDDQVRMIESCLRLHGQLCPQQMLGFHGTLDMFFRKNFAEEIQRLAVDTSSLDVSSITRSTQLSQSSYPQSLTEYASIDRSPAESSSSARPQLAIASIDLNRNIAASPPLSPQSVRDTAQVSSDAQSTKQTPLQRHLAHLARHGFNGVASGPRDHTGSDSISEGSPHDSYMMNGASIPINANSGASMTTSTMGSIGSLRGRFSKFGSLNFGRRD